jgi:hypothetical protein
MLPNVRTLATTGVLLITLAAGNPALAQRQRGVLRLLHFDSPASMSIGVVKLNHSETWTWD